MSLQQRGVKSDYLGSTQMNSSVSSEAEKGLYDVLYMTPEKAISLPSRCEILSYKIRLWAFAVLMKL
jgi:ATP-dependent DNA helicase RecQ